MTLTEEQQKIIASKGNIKINAVAGSGKTTTIVEYAKSRPPKSRILYLAFNKAIKEEAIAKFKAKGLKNVTIETAHSLAFRHIMPRYRYKLKQFDYKIYEIAELLKLGSGEEAHFQYILATHVQKFCSYFCNSDALRVEDLDYRKSTVDPKVVGFIDKYYDEIEKQTKIFFAKMDKGEIEITHDFYLKKFQLSNPTLFYDYILFDEGQDASGSMLDVFRNFHGTKVIVGDTHQQIYGWRYAVNSLEKLDYPNYHLNNSFRFNQAIADLAKSTLQWKTHLKKAVEVKLVGKGQAEGDQLKAVIARTNIGLLYKAIDYVSDQSSGSLYFEGTIHSYTYADEGASLYDVLSLHNGKHHLIKDKLIQRLGNIEALKEYVEQTGDAQLGMMLKIVEEYGNKIPGLIKKIKERHIEKGAPKDQAKVIFTTVHRCKGVEYDEVEIADDFKCEGDLTKMLEENKPEHLDMNALNEEINLLYVAITRTRNKLIISDRYIPAEFPVADNIEVIYTEEDWEAFENEFPSFEDKNTKQNKKAYTVETVRKKYKNAYAPWNDQLDEELEVLYCEGKSVQEMANHFGRTYGAIRSRIEKLELEDLYS